MPEQAPPAYELVNCPFDADYRSVFQALVFTIHQCGFYARCALEAEDSGEIRMRKIKRLIRECGYGIHDISRVQPDPSDGLPRFNVPLELGLFLGAQEYGPGPQRQKRSLILDAEPDRYHKFCSDIAGQDIRAHGGHPARAIAAVRAMLSPRWKAAHACQERPRSAPGTRGSGLSSPPSAGASTCALPSSSSWSSAFCCATG